MCTCKPACTHIHTINIIITTTASITIMTVKILLTIKEMSLQ